ncbi:hypothetical protein RND81_05G183000 [Saponaria officinalis]|uniref:BHLH domain-containing protein n=1 Tax=Saponaria officinalis TaxID=3572 RepID=A0AAW1KZR4_SAPOF
MQHYLDNSDNININNNNSSEMELYRYLTAAEGDGGVGHGGAWPPTAALSYNYGGGGGGGGNSNNNNNNINSGYYPGAVAMGLLNEDETAEAKAVAASRIHHKEAEKRRRERINSHLDRLRSLLPCTSKTDKATLLSKVVQRVLELKRQTSEINELHTLMIPSENDEFNVYLHNNLLDNNNNNNDDNNNDKIILKASLCCEDRPDLFSDLNGILNSLNLKTVRAEISTLGGRVQSVLVVSADNARHGDECAVFLRDALKGIVNRSGSEERLKRRRRAFDSDC